MSDHAPSRLRVLYDIVLQVAGVDALTSFRSAFAGSAICLPKRQISRPFSEVFGCDTSFVIVALYWRVVERLCLPMRHDLYINSDELAFRCQARAEGLALIANGATARAAARQVGISERTMQQARLGRRVKVGTTFHQAIAEQIRRCSEEDLAIVEAARVKLRNKRREENRRKIVRLMGEGRPRHDIMQALGVSSATLSVYLTNLRKSGQIGTFRFGPKAGSKLDGSAWRGRKAVLLKAYDDGLSRDEMAARLGYGRRRLTQELVRLHRETGRSLPLPWKRIAHTLGPDRIAA